MISGCAKISYMDKKTRIFFLVFFGLIAISVLVTFFKYFVQKDYYIKAEAECDPYTEKCFVYVCDPETEKDCPEDEGERTSYYKYIEKKAYLIPLVDPNSEDFPGIECQKGENGCREILCDEKTVAKGEECNDPVKYTQDNPVEEECAEDDEKCLEETNSQIEDSGTGEDAAGSEE